MEYSCWLKNELAERGWTQGKLAYKTGLSRATISRVLKNERQPTGLTKRLIDEALGISEKNTRTSELDIIQNALLQCPSLDEWDRNEILQTVKLKLERKAKQKSPPLAGRGEDSGRGVAG